MSRKQSTAVERDCAPSTSGRGARRRRAILDAASEEFLKHGYQTASLREIIKAAGGSAETLYRHFGSKAGLFQSVISYQLERDILSHLTTDTASNRTVEEDLYEFGLAYVTTVTQPEPIAFMRLLIAEAATTPDIGKVYWQFGPRPIARHVQAYLERKIADGELILERPDLAAMQFVEMAKGGLHFQIMCTGRRPDPKELSSQVREAVKVFLQGAMPRD